MMPTLEKLEESMAIAICERDHGEGGCNIKTNKGREQDCMKAECYPAMYAKVALQTLLSNLPEVDVSHHLLCNPPMPVDNAAQYYKQLLGMKK